MSSPTTPIEAAIAVTPAPNLGSDTPLAHQAGARSGRGAFIVSQALSAASATLPETWRLYSSQSTFLAPANPQERIIYRVERTFSGRVCSTRTVHATQSEVPVYLAVVSFQSLSALEGANVLNYGLSMPDLDGVHPDDIDAESLQTMRRAMVGEKLSLPQLAADDKSLDWRPLGMDFVEDPSKFRLRGFVRAPAGLSTASPAVHLAAFGFASDEMSFGPALAANATVLGRGFRNISTAASLTHNISFHDPQARIDDWVVLERDTTWGASGRVLVSQRIWGLKSGRLIMSGTQEALILLKVKTAKM
ncbi:Thioesterase/thiol ester dehydrase-isomerase [Thozetella sp. PMI_491]|nr:Thioesterase/thiol ester dehydrase-isomerase [Thozetella sp. PMI_491]